MIEHPAGLVGNPNDFVDIVYAHFWSLTKASGDVTNPGDFIRDNSGEDSVHRKCNTNQILQTASMEHKTVMGQHVLGPKYQSLVKQAGIFFFACPLLLSILTIQCFVSCCCVLTQDTIGMRTPQIIK
jgi:hypothetical protein